MSINRNLMSPEEIMEYIDNENQRLTERLDQLNARVRNLEDKMLNVERKGFP